MGDVKFEVEGGGELRQVGKAGMDRVVVVCRIKVLG